MVGVRSQLVPLLLAVFLGAASTSAVFGQEAEGSNDLVFSLLSDGLHDGFEAARLLNGKTRVAIWPFQEKDVPVDPDMAESFNNRLLARFKQDVGRKLVFVGRKELRALIADLEESGQGLNDPIATVSKSAVADVLIVGKIRLTGGVVNLSYKAMGSSGRNMGKILAATDPQSLKLGVRGAAMTLDRALHTAARKLADLFPDLRELRLGGIRFQSSRIQTPFSRYVEQRAADEFTDVFSNVISGRLIKVKRDSLKPEDMKPRKQSRQGSYVLSGSYWDFGSAIDLRLRLRADDGRTASWRGRVLPPAGIVVRPEGNFPAVLLENDGLGPFRFRLSSANGDDPVYYIGDKLNLMVQLESDAWLYCFYRQADGRMVKIIPNQFHREALVKGGRVLTLPGRIMPFDLNIGEPPGIELVKCFALSRDVTSDLPDELQALDFTFLPEGMDFRLPTIFRSLDNVTMSEASIVITVQQPNSR